MTSSAAQINAPARPTGRTRPPVPPGNLAYRKQGQLLSVDGSRELTVNSGTQFPKLGVDGRLDTHALAGGEWAWSFHVDLVDVADIRRVKVTFGKGYATHFEFRVSLDGQTWETVASKADHGGSPFEASFDPVRARYVRVSAGKPDGPEQPGTQMSIAELEVYD